MLNMPNISHDELRKPTEFISPYLDDITRNELESMFKIMKANKGVGLAANQIGINKRMAVVRTHSNGPIYFLVNPVVVSTSNEFNIGTEGCLSLKKEYEATVVRHEEIVIDYFDEFGIQRRLTATGFLARVIQHELDHLDGKLIIDRDIQKGK